MIQRSFSTPPFLFAWFQVGAGTAAKTVNSKTAVAKDTYADVGSLTITVNFANLVEENIDLTVWNASLNENAGDVETYVRTTNNTIKSVTPANPVSSANTFVVSLSLSSPEDLAPYEGTYEIYVDAGAQIRVGASENAAKQAEAGGEVKLGEVVISATGEVTLPGSSGTVTYYYCLSPKNAAAVGTNNEEQGADYTITAKIKNGQNWLDNAA